MTPILFLLLMPTDEIVNPIPALAYLWITDQGAQLVTDDGYKLIFKD